MKKDILKERWINVSISVVSSPGGAIDMRNFLKEIAREFDFEFKETEIDSYTSDHRFVQRVFSEQELDVSKLLFFLMRSPLFLEKLIPMIQVPKSKFPLKSSKKILENPIMVGKATFPEESHYVCEQVISAFIILKYPLIGRMELEDKHPETAKEIFLETTEDFIKRLEKENRIKYYEYLFNREKLDNKKEVWNNTMKLKKFIEETRLNGINLTKIPHFHFDEEGGIHITSKMTASESSKFKKEVEEWLLKEEQKNSSKEKIKLKKLKRVQSTQVF